MNPNRQPTPHASPDSNASRQAKSLERLARIERRKARNRAFFLAFFVMATMFVTIILIISIMRQAKPNPRFMFIQEGELVHTVQSKGLILRDELTLSAPASGLLKPMATEGSRAAKGEKLALIIPADKEDQLRELQKCEKDIVDLQIELMNKGKGAGAQAIFDESAGSLETIVNLVRADISRGTLANLSIYAASISVVLEQRSEKLATIDFNDSRFDALEMTRKSLEDALGLSVGTLKSTQSGIISFKLDGLESILSLDRCHTLTADEYRSYIEYQAPPVGDIRTVTQDQPVIRILSGLNQCLVFLLPDTSASLYKVNDTISVAVPADGLVISNCRVLRSETAGSDALVVVRTDRQVERLSDRRTVIAELTVATTKGLKVPTASLIEYDAATKQAGLMLVIEGKTRFCQVKVIDQDREYAIIKAIPSEKYQPAVSSVLVVNPESIEAGELIGN
ncbi:MAG TPA: hypothetical protein DD640_04790 [Clostridiales bacterium]|nr:hypothetical protein [Clostridiales bacterium]